MTRTEEFVEVSTKWNNWISIYGIENVIFVARKKEYVYNAVRKRGFDVAIMCYEDSLNEIEI